MSHSEVLQIKQVDGSYVPMEETCSNSFLPQAVE
jgi:hypothetical protein